MVTLTVIDFFGVENKTTRSISVNMDETREDVESESTDIEESSCQTGDSKSADDGCNQCVCNGGDWMCTEIACEDPEIEESLLPSLSLISVTTMFGLIARYRRK